ncbi:MAG: putative Co/Zn/Cd efflux system rane fusion protein [Polyangiaceae bacterium]|jgi:RND family efflux transporter MFP subunit|nr:putative Co/Zn/Cd efflux system rane fusion protein [Polyangiaceae bacterium]
MSDSNVVGRGTGEAAPQPERVKAPLVGIIVGVLMVGGLVVWTGSRVATATKAQAALAEKRAVEAEKTVAAAKAPERVNVVKGAPATWLPSVILDGTLAAEQSASVGFKVGGKIGSLKVKVGDQVRAGQLLATLDATEAGAQAAATAAQVRAAEAQLALAQDTARRTQAMVQSGSFAEASGVQSTQQQALAQAQLDAAKAQSALTRVSLGNHSLVAPFAGTVTKVPDGIGEVVGPGAPLFEVVNTKVLKLSTTVSEHDANLLTLGAPVQLELETGKATGRLSAVLGTVDPKTRRVPVQASFDNPGFLRAGAFVQAHVDAKKEIAVLRLPHEVLRPGSQDELVLVGEGGRLDVRHVVLAVDKDGSLLVRRGLAPTEQVVAKPKPEAKAGDIVTVEPAGTKP